MKLIPVIAALFVGLGTHLLANNIQVRNIELKNLNEASNWVHVEFDLDWQNSWRVDSGPSNWDAAWVFIKYRVNGGPWTHGVISQANSTTPAGTLLEVTDDGVGALIYREAVGSGTFDANDIQIRWDFGLTDLNDVIDIKVFAIEMACIPEGAFSVGGTAGNEVNKFHAGGFSTSSSFRIISENALQIADTIDNLYYTNPLFPALRSGPTPASVCKGPGIQ